jgi:hypothetical protein
LINSKIAEIVRLQIREAACDSQHRTASLIGAEEPYVSDIGAERTYIGPGIQHLFGKAASRLLEELQPILQLACGVEFPAAQITLLQ